jgi:beta propeller repeat protein
MYKFRRIVMISLLVFPLLLNTPQFVIASTTYTPNGGIASDGGRMVWSSEVGGHPEIILYDQSGERKITDYASDKRDPDINGNYIVWQDDRNDEDSTIRQYDIFLYNLATNEELKVSQPAGNYEEPKIDGNYIVWRNTTNGFSDVMLYQIQTGTLENITTGAQTFGLEIQGEQIVWMQYNSPYFDIYSYDINSNQTTRLTNGYGHHKDPRVSGGKIVWHDYREGVRNIYLYDTTTGTEQKVTNGDGNKTIKGFVNGKLLYASEATGKVYLKDIESDQENELNIDLSVQKPILLGNEIAIITPLGIVSYPTSALIAVPGGFINDNVHATSNNPVVKEDRVLSIDTTENVEILEHSFETNNMVTTGKLYEISTTAALKSKLKLTFRFDQPLDHKYAIYGLKADVWEYLGGGYFGNQRKVEVDIHEYNQFIVGFPKLPFVDTESNWAKEEVHFLYSHQIIHGYNESQFKPDHTISRAEFVKLIVKALDLKKVQSQISRFEDVPENHWASNDIVIAASLGIVKGNGTQFYPSKTLTREEIVTILARAATYMTKDQTIQDMTVLDQYLDSKTLNNWSMEAFAYSLANGIVKGTNERMLDPAAFTKRSEAAVFIVRLMDFTKGVDVHED